MLNKKNVRKIVSVLFFFIIFIFSSVDAGLNNSFNKQPIITLSGDVFYVGGYGPDNYTRIQDAIDNASDGDTVFVFGDSSPYHENVVVDKSIFLIGEDKNLVVIDADFKGAAVAITADDVFVSGFKMIHPHEPIDELWDSTLVDIVSIENVTIRDNIMEQIQIFLGDWRSGICIRNSSYCFIQNNIIRKETDTRPCAGVAVIIGSTFNNVSGNEVYNYTEGVLLEDCSDNVIYMNYLHHNGAGIYTVFDNDNKIINNIINFNIHGIRIDEGCNNVVFGNIVTDNGKGGDDDCGIGILGYYGGHDNCVSYNHISNNNPKGIVLIAINNNITYNHISKNNIGVSCEYGFHNFIIKNNFILNKKNGYFLGSVILRNIWRGNYWNRPRLLPYPIFGNGFFSPIVNFDWHPALKPYDI